MSFIDSLFGSPGKSSQSSVSGFNDMPTPVQNFLLDQYLPKMQDYLNKPYQAVPMGRYTGNDPQMQAFQQYSDAQGGVFSPYNNGQAQTQAPVQPQQQQPLQMNADLLKGIAGLAQYTMPYGLGKTTKGMMSGGGGPTMDEYIQNLLSNNTGGMSK